MSLFELCISIMLSVDIITSNLGLCINLQLESYYKVIVGAK